MVTPSDNKQGRYSEHLRYDPSSYALLPYDELALQFKNYFNEEPVLFQILDHGASVDFEKLRKQLDARKVRYSFYNAGELKRLPTGNNGEYRPLAPPQTVERIIERLERNSDSGKMWVNPRRASALISFDDWTTTGASCIGGTVIGLSICEYFDIPSFYTATGRCNIGANHFAQERSAPYRGLVKFMEEEAPITLKEFRAKGLVRRISPWNPTELDMAPSAIEIEEDINVLADEINDR